MSIIARLRRLETTQNATPAAGVNPTYAEMFATLRGELAAGLIEERAWRPTADGPAAYHWLTYTAAARTPDLQNALQPVLSLIATELAPLCDWTTNGYAADYRGLREPCRPQTIEELTAWLDFWDDLDKENG